jgi:hypothetical protein
VDIELRGYVDGSANLGILADAVKPMGVVVMASPAADDYNPFVISEPENPPTIEKSLEIIQGFFDQADAVGANEDELVRALAELHFGQALVIRGERGQREYSERENEQLRGDHTDSEKALIDTVNKQADVIERIKTARSNHPECNVHPDDDTVACGWKRAVQDIDKALAEVPE